MKKFLLTCMALIFATSLFAKDIQQLTVTTIPPMSCENCENKIKKNLRFEKGVKKIETNIPEQRVVIDYDADKTDPSKIETAFQKIGYKVDIINATEESSISSETDGNVQTPPACCGN